MNNKKGYYNFLMFTVVLGVLFLSILSVSAGTYDFTLSNSTDNFQSVIDNDTDDELVINLNDGDYSLNQINVNRSATIQGKSKNGAKISGTGTLFNITSSNVKIINLTITGFDTAITSNSGDLTIIGNNIITNNTCININFTGDLKRINIENNNMQRISNFHAYYNNVYVCALGSDNNLTFINNNITSLPNGAHIVYIETSFNRYGNSNKTNILFINNNIIGIGHVSIYAGRSNNLQINFTNNNITGTLFSLHTNNNNISFIGNNIIGGSTLAIYDGKNSNLSFINNNVNALCLIPHNCINNSISVIGNNITSVLVSIKDGGTVSGVSFLNNTINSTGDGFYFQVAGVGSAPIAISDFVIRGNIIYAPNGVAFNFNKWVLDGPNLPLPMGSCVNVIVEYNRIIAPVGVNITGFDDSSSFDYNWWGTNDITGKVFGVDINNYYILNITNISPLRGVHFGDTVSFGAFLVLNTNFSDHGYSLLYFVNVTYNGQSFIFDYDNDFTGDFIVSGVGTQVLSASLDNQDLNLVFNASMDNTNSTINIPDNILVGDNITISGYLANYTGVNDLNVSIEGVTELVNINNETGFWSLEYIANHGGTINVTVSLSNSLYYENFKNSTNFNVIKANTNSTININSNNVHIGDNILISGYLTNYTKINKVNVTINGNTKSMNINNETGFWSLNYTANHAGTIKVIAALSGNSFHEDFTNSTSFTINKFSVVSTFVVYGKFIYGETITLKSKLKKATNNSLSLKGKLVKFYVNNKFVGSKKTDSNGIATFNYKIASTKKLTLKTVFTGDSEYNTKTSNIIAKTPSKATVNMALSSKLYKKMIKVVLKFKGKVLKFKWVKFYVKGKYVGKAKTNSKGIALFKYTKKHGKLAIKTVFAGDNLFKSVKLGRKIKL